MIALSIGILALLGAFFFFYAADGLPLAIVLSLVVGACALSIGRDYYRAARAVRSWWWFPFLL